MDPVLTSRALRGLRLRCKSGLHAYRLITAVKVDGEYRRTERCKHCGGVRIKRGVTPR